jgi:hypothetical protein
MAFCGYCKQQAEAGLPLPKKCTECSVRKDDGFSGYLRPEPLVDDDGVLVPIRLVPVFETVKAYKAAERHLTSLAKAWTLLEASPAREAKPVDPEKLHYMRFREVLRACRWRLKMMRPALVCQRCGGDGCGECENHGRQLGYLTVEMVEARKASCEPVSP